MANNLDWIVGQIESSSQVFQQMTRFNAKNILSASVTIIEALNSGKKVLWCGNGGSAGQAQHLSAELVCGLRSHNRPALASLSLTTDTSLISAWSNDVDYLSVFSRQLEALGKSGDILIALSTSGSSLNVLEVLKKAQVLDIYTIGLTGNHETEMKNLCDLTIAIPSKDTQRIQEGHILAGHLICELIENHFIN